MARVSLGPSTKWRSVPLSTLALSQPRTGPVFLKWNTTTGYPKAQYCFCSKSHGNLKYLHLFNKYFATIDFFKKHSTDLMPQKETPIRSNMQPQLGGRQGGRAEEWQMVAPRFPLPSDLQAIPTPLQRLARHSASLSLKKCH